MDLLIRFVSGSMRGQTKAARISPGGRVRLGRAAGNEIRLADDPVVSSVHATIANEGGSLVLYDNDSTNGTTYHGKHVRRAVIRSGDRFVLGRNGPELEFVYSESSEPAVVAAAVPPPIARDCALCGGRLGPDQVICPSCRRVVCRIHILSASGTCEGCSSANSVTMFRQSAPPPPIIVRAPFGPPAGVARSAVPPPQAPPHVYVPAQVAPPPAPPAPPVVPPRLREERAREVLAAEGFLVRERRPSDRDELVFRAERVDFGQEVVAKILLRDRAAASPAEARFLREARLAARLRHPNVIALYDVRVGEGYILLVLESLHGRTLADEIHVAGRLAPARALSVAAAIARALVYLHGLGIVHRNIRPECVIVTDEHEVKLSDLGLVKSVAGERPYPKATVQGDILGSLGHIAPEQVIDAKQVDGRADIYALGALIFHAIAGRPPHAGLERLDLAERRELPPAPRLDEAVPEAPPLVVELVSQAMDPWPERRFGSAAEMLGAIEQIERTVPNPHHVARTKALPAFEHAAPPGAESTSEGFAGKFKGTQVVELLQMAELHRKTGTLEISSDEGFGTLDFSDGRIAGAVCGSLTGIEAAYRLLAMKTGFFRLRFHRHVQAPPPQAPTISSVIFEHLRRIDEESTLAAEGSGGTSLLR